LSIQRARSKNLGAGTEAVLVIAGKLVNVASAFIERMNPEKKIIGEREACLER